MLFSVFHAVFMAVCVAFGAFAWDFTQHSTIFLHFVTLMSPLLHHPLILWLHLLVFVSLSRASIWTKAVFRSSRVQSLSFVFHTTQLSCVWRVSIESRLSWSSMESHKYTVLESCVPHQHSLPLEADGKKTGAATAGSP